MGPVGAWPGRSDRNLEVPVWTGNLSGNGGGGVEPPSQRAWGFWEEGSLKRLDSFSQLEGTTSQITIRTTQMTLRNEIQERFPKISVRWEVLVKNGKSASKSMWPGGGSGYWVDPGWSGRVLHEGFSPQRRASRWRPSPTWEHPRAVSRLGCAHGRRGARPSPGSSLLAGVDPGGSRTLRTASVS